MGNRNMLRLNVRPVSGCLFFCRKSLHLSMRKADLIPWPNSPRIAIAKITNKIHPIAVINKSVLCKANNFGRIFAGNNIVTYICVIIIKIASYANAVYIIRIKVLFLFAGT